MQVSGENIAREALQGQRPEGVGCSGAGERSSDLSPEKLKQTNSIRPGKTPYIVRECTPAAMLSID